MRHIPEAGAVCGSSARTDLCGGRQVTAVPTATPVWLHEGRIEVQFSNACPQDDAVRINTICQSQDGIDEIHCDGSVTFNPQCMAVMQAMLGYSKKNMSIEQSAEFARELASKYAAFKVLNLAGA